MKESDDLELEQLGAEASGANSEETSPRTSPVVFFAVEHTQTHGLKTTPQLWPVSYPLAEPRQETYYCWRARLHEVDDPDYVSSSNADAEIEALADNFAYNYRTHQDPQLAKMGEASYRLILQPSEEELKRLQSHYPNDSTVRALSATEAQHLWDAFREANRRSQAA